MTWAMVLEGGIRRPEPHDLPRQHIAIEHHQVRPAKLRNHALVAQQPQRIRAIQQPATAQLRGGASGPQVRRALS